MCAKLGGLCYAGLRDGEESMLCRAGGPELYFIRGIPLCQARDYSVSPGGGITAVTGCVWCVKPRGYLYYAQLRGSSWIAPLWSTRYLGSTMNCSLNLPCRSTTDRSVRIYHTSRVRHLRDLSHAAVSIFPLYRVFIYLCNAEK